KRGRRIFACASGLWGYPHKPEAQAKADTPPLAYASGSDGSSITYRFRRSTMRRTTLGGSAALLACATAWLASAAGQGPSLQLTQRLRLPAAQEPGTYDTVLKQAEWAPKQTAVIVCDMWDSHHSLNAVRRVGEIAPRMNQVLEKARGLGALIIHAPSGCMAPYKDHPGRKLAQGAPKA